MRAKRWDDERGSVTAEFALTIPAVLLVLGIVIGGITLAAQRVTLAAAAGDVARLEARGDTRIAAARIAELPSTVTLSRERIGELLCVTARSAPGRGLLAVLTVSARSCAALSLAVEG